MIVKIHIDNEFKNLTPPLTRSLRADQQGKRAVRQDHGDRRKGVRRVYN